MEVKTLITGQSDWQWGLLCVGGPTYDLKVIITDSWTELWRERLCFLLTITSTPPADNDRPIKTSVLLCVPAPPQGSGCQRSAWPVCPPGGQLLHDWTTDTHTHTQLWSLAPAAAAAASDEVPAYLHKVSSDHLKTRRWLRLEEPVSQGLEEESSELKWNERSPQKN